MVQYFNSNTQLANEHAHPDDLMLLAVGESNLVLVSTDDGRVRATINLPRPPVSAPVLGDFNNDGVADVIITTANGYYSFAIERRPNVGGALFAALVAILLIILGTVWVMTIIDSDDVDSEAKYIRSTDDDDDDWD